MLSTLIAYTSQKKKLSVKLRVLDYKRDVLNENLLTDN